MRFSFLALAAWLAACVDPSSTPTGPRARLPGAAPAPAPLADPFLTYAPRGREPLPAYKTAWEEELERRAAVGRGQGLPGADFFSDYRDKNVAKFFTTAAPTSAFRTPAEYEPAQAYLLHWAPYPGSAWAALFGGIVKGAWGVAPVLMVHTSASHKSWLEGQLTALGIPQAELSDPSKIIWYQHTTDAIWSRDYGPISILSLPATGQGALSFVDFRYYPTRVYDDEIPSDLAAAWGVNVYRPDLAFEGGNFMTTSDGLCASSKGTLYYNLQYSQSAIEEIYKTYLGCKKLLWPTPMTGGVIAHIDMFAKLASDTSVLVGEYGPLEDAKNQPILDANAALFAAATNGSGQPLSVIRIPMPSNAGGKVWRTYTNSLALNKTLLIPTYSADTSHEAAALKAYADAFPGFAQVTIDSEVIIPLQGAIHCITMQIPVGAKVKMEADPPPLCGATVWQCVKTGCGTITAKGCCAGEILKYCSSSGKLSAKDCAGTPSCGWNAGKGYYDCATAGLADPSGVAPRSCDAVTDAALPPSDAPGKAEAGPDLQQSVDLAPPDRAPPEARFPEARALEPRREASSDGPRADRGGDLTGSADGCSCALEGGPAPSPAAWLLALVLALRVWSWRRGRAAGGAARGRS